MATSTLQPAQWLIVGGAILAALLLRSFVQAIFHRQQLADIPGPWLAKWTDLQRAWYMKSLRSHKIHADLHARYGPLVRMGPNMVSLSDPAAIPALYPTRPGFIKSKFYDAFIPYTPTGSLPAIFTTQDEALHKQLKSPIAPLYSLTNVLTYEPAVNQVLAILFEQVDRRFVQTGQTFDLGDWLQYFAFDVMGTMTFSRRYGFLERGEDVDGMLAAIWRFMLGVAPMTQVPWLDRLLNKNRLMARLKKQSGNAIAKVAADSVAERKKAENDTRSDFLAKFLEVQASNSGIPQWSATAWTFSNVIAGSDSTAITMRTVMYHLLSHPDTHDRLLGELHGASLSMPFPSWHQVADLPYLDACVWESIRIHPAFASQFERVVPKSGVTIGGRFFAPGTIVGMNPYVVNRDRATFGEDADSWRPERWLGSVEHKRHLEQSVLTFGAGRRACLGRYVALLEIKKLVPALLLNYTFDLVDPAAYRVESSHTFRQSGIIVQIKRQKF